MNRKQTVKQKGAIKQMAGHFDCSRTTIRRHLRGEVNTCKTAEILEYCRQHYTLL